MTLYGNPQLTGVEREFDNDEIIVTKTDLSGKMTYVNRCFLRLAGYEEMDTLGVQHNLIRHPDMPRAVFELLWNTLNAGQEVFAYVVNRSKNGDHYWVFAHVTPSYDASGAISGYHSSRRLPNKQIITDHIEPLYKKLLHVEQTAESPKKGLKQSYQAVVDLLTENKIEYNQFIFSLGT
ncbi:MAG: PAS domain-containing protein [Hyphomicrobiales bacterium]|nr:PAS domain-containing protein [Hyphomicrobiales bacterium]